MNPNAWLEYLKLKALREKLKQLPKPKLVVKVIKDQ